MNKIKQQIAETFLELAEGLESGQFGQKVKIAITGLGSEHGQENIMQAALAAARDGIEVLFIGTLEAPAGSGVTTVHCDCENEAFKIMEDLLAKGDAQGAVAMHYPFPIGVSTVGRSVCPSSGKQMFIANTTGTSSTDRIEGMVLNTLAGLAAAKACGIADPTVGLLNLDGIRQVEMILKDLQKKGYKFRFAESARADGGAVLRGNDVLLGTPDVMVCDSLTGNVLTKMLSAFTSGGTYETQGFGYGPGLGDGYKQLVLIISRASGAPLVANAIRFAAELVRGSVMEKVDEEYAMARKAGLNEILAERRKANQKPAAAEETVACPEKEIVTAQIAGIDVMDLEDAVKVLWKNKIYAEDGMGCTGPIIRVSEANKAKAVELLTAAGYVA